MKDDKDKKVDAVPETKPEPSEILQEIGFDSAGEIVQGEPAESEPKPKPKKKRRRGRPSKQEIYEEAAVEEMKQKAETLISIGLSALVVGAAEIIARYLKDERWRITDPQEAQELACVIKAYLDLRLPQALDTPEGMLILGLSGYVFKRLDWTKTDGQE